MGQSWIYNSDTTFSLRVQIPVHKIYSASTANRNHCNSAPTEGDSEFDCGCNRCQRISRFTRLRSCEEWQCFSQRRKSYPHCYMNTILRLLELRLWLIRSLRSFFPACRTGSPIYYNNYEIRTVFMTILIYFNADWDRFIL